MKLAFAALLALHGAIHLAGFARAFGLADLPQLGPVSRGAGLGWLAAGLGFVTAAALLFVGQRAWWVPAAAALLLSQALVFGAFREARFGSIANAIILVPVLVAALDLRSSSLWSIYQRETRREIAQRAGAASGLERPIAEADLAPLPTLVATYLRRAGVVGRPRVRALHATFRARMRNRPDAAFMPATVEQDEFFGAPGPARLFFMEASRAGLPFVVFHRYVGDAASMQVRVAGLIEVARVAGSVMTQSETVTLLNDMCFLAPAALLDAPIVWRAVGPSEVEARYTNAGHTVTAVLSFDAAGDLVGFVSGDRHQLDGKSDRLVPWSTPLRDFRDFGGVRLPATGEAMWREPSGAWTYGEFTLERISYN
jgi:hypothetical protein